MNFKKLMVSVMSAGLVVSLGMNSMTANAVEGENEAEITAESEAKVKFTVPDVVEVDLYDPKNPGQTIDKEKAGEKGKVTGQTGPLTLDYVTDLDFGEAEISSATEEYEFTAADHHLQVTDRRGTGTGWHITAKASEFNSGDEPTLPSSRIILNSGKADSPVSFDEKQAPVVKGEIEITTGDPDFNVASAAPKEEGTIDTAQGLGTWIIKWLTDDDTPAEVKLLVPARSASVGDHTATITWTLADGPATAGQ